MAGGLFAIIGTVTTIVNGASQVAELIGKSQEIAEKLKPVGNFVQNISGKKDLPEKVTETAAKLIDSKHISFDLRKTLTDLLPGQLAKDINDPEKDTITTVKEAKEQLNEVMEFLDIIEKAEKAKK